MEFLKISTCDLLEDCQINLGTYKNIAWYKQGTSWIAFAHCPNHILRLWIW